ncbi:hypothetical protein AWB69_08550 [Caballeronia udeis]|uniref:DUF6440 domain-containing protein n=1 Tax=Caballeronia udeis TaxID=1232866 RepID=A0A158JRP9_9BURK|nr:DUF6440 family protein [Caballeronia udeis]SAL71109.1 hypothetical protein AWB69_08550 [Caballeronia udeis]
MKWLLVLLATSVGCSAYAAGAESRQATNAYSSRFTRETTEDINIQVETDHETGCRYLIAENRGITPMLKSNGTPDCNAPKRGQQ